MTGICEWPTGFISVRFCSRTSLPQDHISLMQFLLPSLSPAPCALSQVWVTLFPPREWQKKQKPRVSQTTAIFTRRTEKRKAEPERKAAQSFAHEHGMDSPWQTLASVHFQRPNLMIVCSSRFSVLSSSLGKYISLTYSRYLSLISMFMKLEANRNFESLLCLFVKG